MKRRKQTTPTLTQFDTMLVSNMRDAVTRLRQQGTVSMSLDNFQQVVRTPSPYTEGAPRGTNARWAYAERFRELASSTPDIATFILR